MRFVTSITIMLGTTVGATANGDIFLRVQTIAIIAMGLMAFCFSTVGGVLLGKLLCVVTGGKINPLIGSAGVSAVPMAARVSQTVGSKENPTNFPSDARDGTKRGRCYRFCCGSRFLHADFK